MAILNKNNIIEIFVIVLAVIFMSAMIGIIILEEFDYIHTKAGNCEDTCSINNKTSHFDSRSSSCRCCDKLIEKKDWGTLIETNCYEVILTNETAKST